MLKLLKKIKDKETVILTALIAGVITLSIGIALIKVLPKVGTGFIIIGSSLIYFSIIILAFVV